MSPATDLAARLAADLATVEQEIAEIDLLIAQARTEAERHEQKRAAASDRAASAPPEERVALTEQVVGLTRRAVLMTSQVEVLEGKRKTMGRFRDALVSYVAPPAAVASDADAEGEGPEAHPELAGLVLGAQEDLRREIARAMHDGPAQSLTNIILQANILKRLVEKDPTSAADEVELLVEMVQQTLDATKSFIFDVRPMVLDDLGLVPTIRRATRDRGKRSGVPVAFESMGTDRRLPPELESALFRIIDLALVAFLAQGPEGVAVRLDWGDRMEVRVRAVRAASTGGAGAGDAAEGVPEETDADLPPALAAMLEERRSAERDVAEAARRAAIVALPDATWREIKGRATTVGIVAELLDSGGDLRLVLDLPAA